MGLYNLCLFILALLLQLNLGESLKVTADDEVTAQPLESRRMLAEFGGADSTSSMKDSSYSPLMNRMQDMTDKKKSTRLLGGLLSGILGGGQGGGSAGTGDAQGGGGGGLLGGILGGGGGGGGGGGLQGNLLNSVLGLLGRRRRSTMSSVETNDVKDENNNQDVNYEKTVGIKKINKEDNAESEEINESMENQQMRSVGYVETSRQFQKSDMTKDINFKETKESNKETSADNFYGNEDRLFDSIKGSGKKEENMKMDNKLRTESNDDIGREDVTYREKQFVNTIEVDEKRSDKSDVKRMENENTDDTGNGNVEDKQEDKLSLHNEEPESKSEQKEEKDDLVHTIETGRQINDIRNIDELNQRNTKEVSRKRSGIHVEFMNLEKMDAIEFKGMNSKSSHAKKSMSLEKSVSREDSKMQDSSYAVVSNSGDTSDEGSNENIKNKYYLEENKNENSIYEKYLKGPLSTSIKDIDDNQPSGEASSDNFDSSSENDFNTNTKSSEKNSKEEKTENENVSESKESGKNTSKCRHRYHHLFPYTFQYNIADIYRTNIQRVYMPVKIEFRPRPYLHRKKHNVPFKRSVPPFQARQLEMLNRYPSSVAGSSFFGSYANAHSGNPLLGEEEGELGQEEEEQEQLGGFGKR